MNWLRSLFEGDERRLRWALVGVTFAVLLANLSGLGGFPLLDVDEPKFAVASRNMARGGDLIVPYFNGVERFDKPILIYWLQTICLWLFGEWEFSVRLPSALAVTAVVPATFDIGRRLGWRPYAALLAGVIAATAAVAQVLAHGATADGLLYGVTAWLAALQVRAFVARRQGGQPGWALHLGTWLLGGVAFLVKGPPALVGPLALGLGMLVAGHRPAWRRVPVGVLLAAVVVLAWGIPALIRSEGRFWEVGVLHHVVERSLTPFEGHGGYAPWWYLFYAVAVPVALLPWTPFLLKARDLPRATLAAGLVPGTGKLLGWWLGGTVAVFTLATSKLLHYPLPAFPAAALAVALVVDRAAASAGGVTWNDRALAQILRGLGILLAIALPAVFLGYGMTVSGPALQVGVIFLVGLWWAGRRAASGRPREAAWATAMVAVFGFGTLAGAGMPTFCHHSLATAVRFARGEHFPPDVRVVRFDLNMPSLDWTLDRICVNASRPGGERPETVALRALEDPAAVLVTRPKRLDRLRAAASELADPDRRAALLQRLDQPTVVLHGFLPSKGKMVDMWVFGATR